MQIDKQKLIDYIKERRSSVDADLKKNEPRHDAIFYKAHGADCELVDLYVKILEGKFDI